MALAWRWPDMRSGSRARPGAIGWTATVMDAIKQSGISNVRVKWDPKALPTLSPIFLGTSRLRYTVQPEQRRLPRMPRDSEFIRCLEERVQHQPDASGEPDAAETDLQAADQVE